jgi:hypothetical protein
VALAVRVGSYKPAGNGSVYLAPGTNQTFSHPALLFKADYDTSEEATVVLHDNTFAVTTADQATELTIDIIGYFIPDTTAGGGAKGDQGERGETGAMGPKGEKGDRGEQGISGAEGSKGEKGDPGVAGAEGAKGEKGDPGVAGAQGEKGDRGEAGVAGAKGEKGDQGDAGVAGAKGEKGDRGDAGVTGAKGEKGDRGDAGVAGAKGEKGDRGDAGATGAKGDRGDRGAQGERGAQGPQGPVGIPGVTMSVGTEMFPPGGNITIYDGNIKANSVILLIYIEVSNGNALGVASQKAGSFVATGSPNKPFKYVIFNMN